MMTKLLLVLMVTTHPTEQRLTDVVLRDIPGVAWEDLWGPEWVLDAFYFEQQEILVFTSQAGEELRLNVDFSSGHRSNVVRNFNVSSDVDTPEVRLMMKKLLDTVFLNCFAGTTPQLKNLDGAFQAVQGPLKEGVVGMGRTFSTFYRLDFSRWQPERNKPPVIEFSLETSRRKWSPVCVMVQ